MAQDQRGEAEIMAAFTSGNYTLSAAEQAQALADRDTEAANQVPPPPFQPPPYDLRTFPQLNLHYAPNILSNYFNCQFSLNEKLAATNYHKAATMCLTMAPPWQPERLGQCCQKITKLVNEWQS